MKTKVFGSLAAVSIGLSIVLSGCGTSSTVNNNASTSNSVSSKPAANAQKVNVVAADFKWTLDKTSFAAGKPIEFDITSKDGMHGFSIDGTSVSQSVSPGQNEEVTWTPPKPGKYTIRCDIYCGSGHPDMVTTFTVK